MTVQDNERERELVRLFNLKWDAAHQRSGVDAFLDIRHETGKVRFEVEVKSTTGKTVSTARDVGMEHIQKWRKKIFVIGFYSRDAGRPELNTCLCLTPLDMEPWIASIEKKILPDFQIAKLASRKLILDDMFAVCGTKPHYTVADAKRLHKKQWSVKQYADAQDVVVLGKKAISPSQMLEIFRLRAEYISERGATLNNPHITKAHLAGYFGTSSEIESDWAESLSSIAKSFLAEHAHHPAVGRNN